MKKHKYKNGKKHKQSVYWWSVIAMGSFWCTVGLRRNHCWMYNFLLEAANPKFLLHIYSSLWRSQTLEHTTVSAVTFRASFWKSAWLQLLETSYRSPIVSLKDWKWIRGNCSSLTFRDLKDRRVVPLHWQYASRGGDIGPDIPNEKKRDYVNDIALRSRALLQYDSEVN